MIDLFDDSFVCWLICFTIDLFDDWFVCWLSCFTIDLFDDWRLNTNLEENREQRQEHQQLRQPWQKRVQSDFLHWNIFNLRRYFQSEKIFNLRRYSSFRYFQLSHCCIKTNLYMSRKRSACIHTCHACKSYLIDCVAIFFSSNSKTTLFTSSSGHRSSILAELSPIQTSCHLFPSVDFCQFADDITWC